MVQSTITIEHEEMLVFIQTKIYELHQQNKNLQTKSSRRRSSMSKSKSQRFRIFKFFASRSFLKTSNPHT